MHGVDELFPFQGRYLPDTGGSGAAKDSSIGEHVWTVLSTELGRPCAYM